MARNDEQDFHSLDSFWAHEQAAKGFPERVAR